jgi:hypothetical protein
LKVPDLVPCKPIPAAAADQETCAKTFITQFGRRAFRRPLTADEASDLLGLYKAERAPDIGAPFADAIGGVIAGMLQSPYFLYHWELGGRAPMRDGALVRLDSYEIASRLSYYFWASMPDETLAKAADDNALMDPARIEQEARRLLAHERAKDAIKDFHFQWLEIAGLPGVEKDPTLKNYTPELAQSMLNETGEFVTQLLFGKQATGKLETLFTSPATFADGPLAKLYGLGAQTGTDLRPVTLDKGQRGGVLTQAAFLSAHSDAERSHPVRRGVSVLHRVACLDITPPDKGVPPPPEPKPGVTNRQRFEGHSAGECVTCHKLIDPIGFAFENYDALGGYQTIDENQKIDASGAFSLGDSTVKFDNAVQMSRQLAETEEVRDCMARQWLRYLLKRREVDGEARALGQIGDTFRGSGYDLRELMVAITKTRAFTHRTPSAGEEL